MIYLTNIDLNKNELQNAVIQPLATAPSSPKLGQIYCDSANKKIKWYNGTTWEVVGVVIEDSTNGKIKVDGVDMTVYELPAANADTLGGIKIGTGLAIGDDGKLNVTGDAVPNEVPWSIVTGKNGKELSTNDYTTAEKEKLAGIAAGAKANVQSDWNADSGDAQILNKPTKLSDFENDQKFITASVNNLTNYYTSQQIDTKFNSLSTITITPVTSFSNLPPIGASNVIYLVPKATADGDNNTYDEYLWNAAASKYEKIGDTTVDLSSYAKSKDLNKVATSGDYNDLTNKPTIKGIHTTSGVLGTNKTTGSLDLLSGSIFINGWLTRSNGEIVMCDITYANNKVTFTLASAATESYTMNVRNYY